MFFRIFVCTHRNRYYEFRNNWLSRQKMTRILKGYPFIISIDAIAYPLISCSCDIFDVIYVLHKAQWSLMHCGTSDQSIKVSVFIYKGSEHDKAPAKLETMKETLQQHHMHPIYMVISPLQPMTTRIRASVPVRYASFSDATIQLLLNS